MVLFICIIGAFTFAAVGLIELNRSRNEKKAEQGYQEYKNNAKK